MIELDHVTAHRGGRIALSDVSLHLERGTVTAVVGPNGAGKSTLFGLLSGRLQPNRGTVKVEGAVAEVLQATAVDQRVALTVHDVVCMGRYPSCGHLRRFRPDDRRAVEAAIGRVDLRDHRRRSFQELSGGQRQRALIAQGIAQDAQVLLLDEPTAGLDPGSQERIMDTMRTESDRGRTVVFATHDLDQAARADLVVALSCACLCCAPPAQALADPEVMAAVGGRG